MVLLICFIKQDEWRVKSAFNIFLSLAQDIFKQATEDRLTSAKELPYFEGDFWPNVLEESIKELEQEEEERKREENSTSSESVDVSVRTSVQQEREECFCEYVTGSGIYRWSSIIT